LRRTLVFIATKKGIGNEIAPVIRRI